jgi:NitT/TauT family transport system substrate-binding protein
MKKTTTLLLALTAAAAITGCSASKTAETTAAQTAAETTTSAETSAPEETTEAETSAEAEATTAGTESESGADLEKTGVTVRVGSLKGPTSMGLVSLMDQAGKGESLNDYEFTMTAAADELTPKIVSGDLDIVLVPANVASVLYNKTKGGVTVIDINTLGVLDVVASDDSIQSFSDLAGKTIYMTGKGTTPDYVFHYLLSANGMSEDDVTLEFKSEASEVAAVLQQEADAIGVLPQPFVTAACAQNENLKIVLDLTSEWDAVQDGETGSRLVTGVTIANTAFLKDHPEAIDAFLAEHKASADFANTDVDAAAELVAAQGIIEKAPVAKKALPYCNITCITGDDMKSSLSGYLQVLADQDASAIGGSLPGDDFYYMK